MVYEVCFLPLRILCTFKVPVSQANELLHLATSHAGQDSHGPYRPRLRVGIFR